MNPATDKQQMLDDLSQSVQELTGLWASYWRGAPVEAIAQRLLEHAAAAWDFWQLSDFDPIERGAVGVVFGAYYRGCPVVIKLSPMVDQAPSMGAQAQMLEIMAPSKVVPLARLSRDQGHTLLMDRLDPGNRLDRSGLSIETQLEIIGNLLRQLHQACEYPGRVPEYDALLRDSPEVLRWPQYATHPVLREDMREYLGGGERVWLIHGDAHAGNVLSHGSAWKLIDPHGWVGERYADNRALLNQGLEQLSEDDKLATRQLEHRFEVYARAADLDLRRLVRAVSFRARMEAAAIADYPLACSETQAWAARMERMAGLLRPL